MFFFWGIGDDTIVGVTRISLLSADVLYITARVVTSAPALKSFTELPPRAFDTLHWTTSYIAYIYISVNYLHSPSTDTRVNPTRCFQQYCVLDSLLGQQKYYIIHWSFIL